MNSFDGAPATAVKRVHGDYTPSSGHARLQRLQEDAFVNLPKPPRKVSSSTHNQKGRFAFVNIWQSVDSANPVLSDPLAIAACDSINLEDAWPYAMMFQDREG